MSRLKFKFVSRGGTFIGSRIRRALALAFVFLLFTAGHASASDCEFRLGFKALRDLIGHDIVGACLENEHYNAIGDSNQQTTGGLMAWRKADNWTAFTDGHRTWVSGPYGVVLRLNTERYYWESDYPHHIPIVVETVCFGTGDSGYRKSASELLSQWRVEADLYFHVFREGRNRTEPWKDKDWVARLVTQAEAVDVPTVALMAMKPQSEQARVYHAPVVASVRHLLTAMLRWNSTLTEGHWDSYEGSERQAQLLNEASHHRRMAEVFIDAIPDIQCSGRTSNREQIIRDWLEAS